MRRDPDPSSVPELLDDSENERADEAVVRPAWARDMPWWATSALLHVILLAVLGGVVMSQKEKEDEEIRHVPVALAKKPPKYDPRKEPDIKTRVKIPLPILEIQHVPKKIDEFKVEIPRGDELSLSDTMLTSDFAEVSIGVGPGGAGAYGFRIAHGPLVAAESGGPDTENAAIKALWWLQRHQHPDGGWRAKDFDAHADGPGCKNRDAGRYSQNKGDAQHDVGVTSLALLAFTGFGYTHHFGRQPEFRACVRGGVDYLQRMQVKSADSQVDGRFGGAGTEEWIYDHAIANMAMAEVLLMSGDFRLKNSVRRATLLSLRAQNPGRGWRYGIQPSHSDTSVTGWMVLALKAAKQCRIGIPDEHFRSAFEGALAWLDYVTASNGKVGYLAPGDQGSMIAGIYPEPYPYSKAPSCMTAVGVLCRRFAGESPKSPMIRAGIDVLSAQPPQWREQKGRSLSTINLYYWYYGSYACFQVGGKPWKRWNEKMKTALLSSQRAVSRGDTEEVDGSWDPIGEWGVVGGRVYSTALAAMTLEVYYRYKRQASGVRL
jgi:hypothetical protein